MTASDFAAFHDLFEEQQTVEAYIARRAKLEEPLCNGSRVTVGQFAAERLHSKERHRTPDSAFDEELRVYHDQHMPEGNNCPKSFHEIKHVCACLSMSSVSFFGSVVLHLE